MGARPVGAEGGAKLRRKEWMGCVNNARIKIKYPGWEGKKVSARVCVLFSTGASWFFYCGG